MKSFWNWIGGIATSVLVGWLIWYITKDPKPPKALNEIVVQGMVYSQQEQAIPNASVILSLAGVPNYAGPYHDMTDEHGSYSFDLDGLPDSWTGQVSATVSGYKSSGPLTLPHAMGKMVRLDIGLVGGGLHPGFHPMPAIHLKFVPKPIWPGAKIKLK